MIISLIRGVVEALSQPSGAVRAKQGHWRAGADVDASSASDDKSKADAIATEPPANGGPPAGGRRMRHQRGGRGGGAGGGKLAAIASNYGGAYKMLRSHEVRRARSVSLTLDLSFSLIVIGSIFLILVAIGQFPTSRRNLEYIGVYDDYLAKYAVYVIGGILGIAAMVLARRALRSGGSLAPAITVLVVSLLSVLACLGLTLYLFTEGAEMGAPWWSYLLNAVMIVQRLLYIIVAVLALWTLVEAHKDEEARKQCEAAHAVHSIGAPPAEVPPPPPPAMV